MLKKDYTVPLFLCLFFLIFSACFLIRDGIPFAHDDINHFRHSLDFRDIFKTDGSLAEKCARVTRYDNPFPPLFFLLTALIFSAAGVSAKTALLTNFILVPLFLLAFCLLARKICGRTGASLLAAASVLSFPLVTAMSRLYYLDFALLVFITLAYTFLLLSDRGEQHDTPAKGAIGKSDGIW